MSAISLSSVAGIAVSLDLLDTSSETCGTPNANSSMPKPKKHSRTKRRQRPKRPLVDLRKLVPNYVHGEHVKGLDKDMNIEGEPSNILLRRFAYDRSLRGRLWTTCCNCGMEHLYTYEVFCEDDGTWWLNKRPYGNPSKPGRKVVRSQRRRLRST